MDLKRWATAVTTWMTWKKALVLVFSIALLVGLLNYIGWDKVGEALSKVGIVGALGLLLPLGLLENACDAFALRASVLGRVRYAQAMYFNSAGALLNVFVPYDAGDILKIKLMTKHMDLDDAIAGVTMGAILSQFSRPLGALIALLLGVALAPAQFGLITLILVFAAILVSSVFGILALIGLKYQALRFIGGAFLAVLVGALVAWLYPIDFGFEIVALSFAFQTFLVSCLAGTLIYLAFRFQLFTRILQHLENKLNFHLPELANKINNKLSEFRIKLSEFRTKHPSHFRWIIIWGVLARLASCACFVACVQLAGFDYSIPTCLVLHAALSVANWLTIILIPVRVGVSEGTSGLVFKFFGLSGPAGTIVTFILRIKGLICNGLTFVIPGLWETLRHPEPQPDSPKA